MSKPRKRRPRREYGKPTDADILKVLESPEWRARGAMVVARHLGVTEWRIRTLRRDFGLDHIPIIEKMNGQKFPLGLVGKNAGSRLSEAQKKRISEIMPKVMEFSRWQANKILNERELLSIAHDALVLAARCWDPRKQPGAPKSPGSKWRAYAMTGVRMAFARAFNSARKKMRRTALFGSHAYQQWVMSSRLNERTVEEAARGDTIDDAETTNPGHGRLYAKFQQMTGMNRQLIEMYAGLVSEDAPRWTIPEMSEFFQITEDECQRRLEEAKKELKE